MQSGIKARLEVLDVKIDWPDARVCAGASRLKREGGPQDSFGASPVAKHSLDTRLGVNEPCSVIETYAAMYSRKRQDTHEYTSRESSVVL